MRHLTNELSLFLSLSLSLSLQEPPNRGVGGTRALAHSIFPHPFPTIFQVTVTLEHVKRRAKRCAMPQVSPDAPRRRKVSGSGAGQRWSCAALCKIQDAKAVPEATVMGEVTRGNSPEKNGMKWMKQQNLGEDG